MHTYRNDIDEPFYTVGHYSSIQGIWVTMKSFVREEDAAEYVSYLNGGRRP